MSKALSVDLRTRVLAAVAAGRRTGTRRLGLGEPGEREPLAAAGAGEGRSAPGPLGGDRRSGRIEAQADLVLGLLAETPDITVEELRAALAARGHAFGYGTPRRVFARRRITRKKRPRTPASRIAPMS